MDLLGGIGSALSGVWNATGGKVVDFVEHDVLHMDNPPEAPAQGAPSLTQDATALSGAATNWEQAVGLSDGASQLAHGLSSFPQLSETAADVTVHVSDVGHGSGYSNPNGGVTILTGDGSESHDVSVTQGDKRIDVDGGVVVHTPDGRTIAADGATTDSNGTSIPIGDQKDITNIGKLWVDPAPAVVANNSASIIAPNSSRVINTDGAGIVGNNGAGLVGNNGAGLVGNNGAGLVGNNGAG